MADGLTRKPTGVRASAEMVAVDFLPRKAFLRGRASVRLAEMMIECEMDRTWSEKVDGPERWGSLPFFLFFSASIEVGTLEASSPEPAEDGRANCRWTS